MELQYTGCLLAVGRSSQGGTPDSLLGAGTLITYQGKSWVIAPAFPQQELDPTLDLMALFKTHDGQQAHRIQLGLRTDQGYRFVHPQEQSLINRGFQLSYISAGSDELTDKGLSPFPLPDTLDFPRLETGMPVRILGLHARQINQKVLGAEDLILPWSVESGQLVSSAPTDVAPTKHSPLRYRHQLLVKLKSQTIKDDWLGALTFVQLPEGWSPLGIQSLHNAYPIVQQVITKPVNHPPYTAVCPFFFIYDVLQNLPDT
ncbi:MAG: hypothetical protein ACQETE_00365 [Bacteroidota bacterium]